MENTDRVPYTIVNGFFKSTLTSPKHISGYTKADKRIMITGDGDTLLRVWTDTGTDFTFRIGDRQFESVNGEVKLFEGGIPLVGQYGGYIFIYSDKIDKVYAEFENYEDVYRTKLAKFHEYSCSDRGVKLRSASGEQPDHIIAGRDDPGHSVNTLYELDD